MSEPVTPYLLANGAVMVLVLGQLLKMEHRLGRGDSIFDRIQKHCWLFNGSAKCRKKKGDDDPC